MSEEISQPDFAYRIKIDSASRVPANSASVRNDFEEHNPSINNLRRHSVQVVVSEYRSDET